LDKKIGLFSGRQIRPIFLHNKRQIFVGRFYWQMKPYRSSDIPFKNLSSAAKRTARILLAGACVSYVSCDHCVPYVACVHCVRWMETLLTLTTAVGEMEFGERSGTTENNFNFGTFR